MKNKKLKCPYCKKYVEINTADHYDDYKTYECPDDIVELYKDKR